MIDQSVKIGEVIEASTREFIAQCHRLYQAPPLGALVRTGGRHSREGGNPIYGVVYDVTTQGIDPGRRPIAMGESEDSEDAVYKSNPQLTQLLRTDARVLALGYQDGDTIYRTLPPAPPHIHAFVYQCSAQEVAQFTSELDFLPLLIDSPIQSADVVAASFLKQASQSHSDSKAFLVKAGKELAALLAMQSQRLGIILRRLAP